MSSTKVRQRGKQVLFALNENVIVNYGSKQRGQQKLTISGQRERQTILILTAGSEMTQLLFFVFVFGLYGAIHTKSYNEPPKDFHLISQTYVTFLRTHYSQKRP